jgi:hypothetical protein
MSDFQSTLSPVLSRLRTSPTFAMSLGSKELFHSNFLGYVLESREPGLCDLQTSLRELFKIPRADGEEPWCFAFRELSSLDLVVVPSMRLPGKIRGSAADERNYEPSGAPCAVIEAKLKALPTAEQLKRYDQKLEQGITVEWENHAGVTRKQLLGLSRKKHMLPVERLLLTLDGELPKAASTQFGPWEGVSWSCVAERIATFASGAMQGGLRHATRAVLTDYAESLKDVLQVVQATRQMYLNSRSRCYADFLADVTEFNELRAARLFDLVGKRAYSEWLVDILNAVRPSGAAGHELGDPIGEAFFTRGMPGLTVEWNLHLSADVETILRIGIQIQGKSYRHFVATRPKWPKLDRFIATSGLLAKWTTGCVTLGSSSETLVAARPYKRAPTLPATVVSKTRATNLKKFGEDAFLYSDIDLSKSGATLADVQSSVCQSMTRAAALAHQIKRLPEKQGR